MPDYNEATSEDDSTSDEEEHQLRQKKKRALKSGMHRTGATSVVTKLTWPHEVMFTAAGKQAAYQDISVPLFIQGSLITIDTQDHSVKQKMGDHLKYLMSGAEIYRWEKTQAFHGVWMNQIKQGWCTWEDGSDGPCCGTLPSLHPQLEGPQEPLPVQASARVHTLPQPGLAPRPARPLISAGAPRTLPTLGSSTCALTV